MIYRCAAVSDRKSVGLFRRAGLLQQLAGLYLKRIGDLTKNRYTGGHIATLDGQILRWFGEFPVRI